MYLQTCHGAKLIPIPVLQLCHFATTASVHFNLCTNSLESKYAEFGRFRRASFAVVPLHVEFEFECIGIFCSTNFLLAGDAMAGDDGDDNLPYRLIAMD